MSALRPTRLLWLVAALILPLLAWPGGASAAPRFSKVGDFAEPIELKAPPGDRRRLFILEKDGVVRLVRDGAVRSQAFLDVSARVENAGERGMLSMAFAPDYATSRRFYVFYTANGGDLQVDEFRRSAASAEVADAATRRSVLTIEHSEFGNHNGGQLHFGPDGLLYLSTGDGGGGGDPHDNGQNTSSLLGKLLRIDPRQSGTSPYRVPAGNPFGNAVYSYGLRNPFRWSFDRQTGDLTIGDVGQNAYEEINFRPRDQGRGANFGWNECEGRHAYPATSNPCTFPSVQPAHEYPNPGTAAVTGGVVVRDSSLPTLFGRYLYADFYSDDIRSARLSASGSSDDRSTGLRQGQVAAFSEDAGGCVYVVSLAGPVYRIADRSPACPAAGSDNGSGGDDTPPSVRLSARRVQRFSKRGIRISFKCGEPCSISALGTFSTPSGTSKVWKLKRVKRKLAAGKRVKLRLKMSRKGSRSARRALRRGHRLRVRVRVRARDAAGNLRTSKLKLKLKR